MQPTLAPKPDRLDSVDCLRGLVMVLMALDHTRDFFPIPSLFAAENARFAAPAVFFTRWVTHFCAPTFVLLAGLGAYLSRTRGLTRWELCGFLFSRGVWLVILELTVVHFGWFLDWDFRHGMWQVIWAIGWSMVGLSLLVWLPAWGVGLLGCAILAGHNTFDGLGGRQLVEKYPDLVYLFGERGWFWDLLHTANRPFSPAPGYGYWSMYPLLPWFGVLCTGYGLGPVMTLAGPRRRRVLVLLGAAAILDFVVLRYANSYGDPEQWRVLPGGDRPMDTLRTTMSFLACTKYPPSLLYCLMTLGPALILLALLEAPLPYLKRFFVTYGRVPLFFYILHLPLIHGLSRLLAWLRAPGGPELLPPRPPYDLADVYWFWAVAVLALYFPCLGYGWLRKRYGGTRYGILLRYL